jgi:hypothetical protein
LGSNKVLIWDILGFDLDFKTSTFTFNSDSGINVNVNGFDSNQYSVINGNGSDINVNVNGFDSNQYSDGNGNGSDIETIMSFSTVAIANSHQYHLTSKR